MLKKRNVFRFTGSANAAGNIVGGNNVVGAANPGQNVANMPADMKRGGDNEWVASNVNNSTGGNWANPRDVRNVAGNQIDIRNADPRGMSNASHFNIPIVHQRDPTRDLLREISRDMTRDVRGDLRGISGKLYRAQVVFLLLCNPTFPSHIPSRITRNDVLTKCLLTKAIMHIHTYYTHTHK